MYVLIEWGRGPNGQGERSWRTNRAPNVFPFSPTKFSLYALNHLTLKCKTFLKVCFNLNITQLHAKEGRTRQLATTAFPFFFFNASEQELVIHREARFILSFVLFSVKERNFNSRPRKMQKGRVSARQNGFLPGWLTLTRPSLTRHLLLWFFMGLHARGYTYHKRKRDMAWNTPALNCVWNHALVLSIFRDKEPTIICLAQWRLLSSVRSSA